MLKGRPKVWSPVTGRLGRVDANGQLVDKIKREDLGIIRFRNPTPGRLPAE